MSCDLDAVCDKRRKCVTVIKSFRDETWPARALGTLLEPGRHNIVQFLVFLAHLNCFLLPCVSHFADDGSCRKLDFWNESSDSSI